MWIDLRPLETNTPGAARLILKQWTGKDGALDLTIQRNQDRGYLQADGTWNSAPHWFQLADLDVSGQEPATIVSAEIVDPLVQTVNAAFRPILRERATQTETPGQVLKVARDLLPSSAAGQSASASTTGSLRAPEAPAAPATAVEPEATAPAPQPVLQEDSGRGRRPIALWSALGALLFAGIAAAIWFFLPRQPAVTVPPIAAAAPAEPPVAAAPCGLEGMKDKTELEFVQACARSKPDSDAMLKAIQAAKQAGQCGIAQRLYANRAQGGDLALALAYAREYDPKYHSASPCFAAPDKATAAYWYETVLGVDANNAEARARLEDLSK